MPGGKNDTDWVLLILVLVFAICVIAFAVGLSTPLPLLDVTAKGNPDGTWTFTATGISELIIAICTGIGIIIKAYK